MPRRTSYSQGTPNWVDQQTTDQARAKSFYGELFGWQFDDQAAPQDNIYSMASKGDGVVAALAPQSPDMVARGAPPTWNTYLAVDDVDAVAKRVGPAGGNLLMEPFDVMDAGRMAFALDPSGAAVGLWQANQHIGATIVNEPGTLIWNELITENADSALPFYQEVFGLEAEAVDVGMGAYTMLKAGDKGVAGSMAPPMEGVPNHWHVYFAVEDVVKAAETARKLGGEVVSGPNETPIGPMAMLRDPLGGTFSVFAPIEPPA